MKRTTRTLAAVLVGAGLLAAAPAAAFDDEKFCPMGGAQINLEVDKDKAIAWGKDRRKVAITGEDGDAWRVLTLSTTDDDIAILVRPASIFFGVAGREGREVDARSAEKVFGNDLRNLREAIRKELGVMRKDDVVRIAGNEVQAISDAAGLGVLMKERDVWELKIRKCDGEEIDTSGL